MPQSDRKAKDPNELLDRQLAKSSWWEGPLWALICFGVLPALLRSLEIYLENKFGWESQKRSPSIWLLFLAEGVVCVVWNEFERQKARREFLTKPNTPATARKRRKTIRRGIDD